MMGITANIRDLKNEKNIFRKISNWLRYKREFKKKIKTILKEPVTKESLVDFGLLHAYLTRMGHDCNTDNFYIKSIPPDVRFDLTSIIQIYIEVKSDTSRFKCSILVANSPDDNITTVIDIYDSDDNSLSHTRKHSGLIVPDSPENTIICEGYKNGLELYGIVALRELKEYIWKTT